MCSFTLMTIIIHIHPLLLLTILDIYHITHVQCLLWGVSQVLITSCNFCHTWISKRDIPIRYQQNSPWCHIVKDPHRWQGYNLITYLAIFVCHAVLDAIGLRIHCNTNYEYLPIMARFTKDTLGQAPIRNSQSHVRKTRHTIAACMCKIRQGILACKVQTSYPNMYNKSHCI